MKIPQLGKAEALSAILQSLLTITNHRTPWFHPYLHFTAYSVTLTTLIKGACVIHTSLPVQLGDAYAVSVPDYVAADYNTGLTNVVQIASAQNAGYSVFLDDTYSSFDVWIGYEGCTATLPPSPIMPALLTAVLTPALAAASSTTALPSVTESSVPVRRVHSAEIMIVSVVVPITGLMVFLLCFIVIRKYRKKRSQAAFTNQSATTSNVQLYVDQKAELEDEKRIKHELESQGIRHEMEGQGNMFEMPGAENTRIEPAPLNRTHELRGMEHSQELEAPGNI